MGVIMFTLLVGKPPFEDKDYKTTYRRIAENVYSFPSDVEISVHAKNLIRDLLHPQASCRPSVEQILSYPFFCDFVIPSYLPTSAMRFPPHKISNELVTPENFWEESKPNSFITPSPYEFTEPKQKTKKSMVTSPKIPLAPASTNIQTTTTKSVNTKKRSLNVFQENFTCNENPLQISKNQNELQLELITKSLNDLLNKNNNENVNTQSQSNSQLSVEKKNHLHVTRWVDESKKVGIGFQLSNQITCAYFNDDTKIAYDPKSRYFHYWEPKIENGIVFLNQEITSVFQYPHIPDGLNKKTEILLHFRHYFMYNKNTGYFDELRADISIPSEFNTDSLPTCVYVQRLVRAKHGITFKLSDGTVQTNFFDKTKLIINNPEKFFVFISSKSDSKFHCLETSDNLDKVVSSRLRYSKECVEMMVKIDHHSLPAPFHIPPAKRQKLTHCVS